MYLVSILVTGNVKDTVSLPNNKYFSFSVFSLWKKALLFFFPLSYSFVAESTNNENETERLSLKSQICFGISSGSSH